MPLHQKLQEIIHHTNLAHLPLQKDIPLEKVREAHFKLQLLAGDPQPVEKIINQSTPGVQGSIPIRFYYPRHGEKLPLLIYFHPGGFVKGDIDSHDTVCRDLANCANCVILSVNYRLAPEHKFPAALEDAYAVLQYMQNHYASFQIDPKKIALGGESAGATIAAVLTHMVKEKRGGELSFQLLIYPQTDFTRQYPSHKEFFSGYLLEEKSLEWYASQYLPHNADLKNPYISPLWFKDFFGLPPALIITAEYDPLRDEGEAYAKKLQKARVKVILHRYEGMTHGFFQMGGILDTANFAMEEAGEALKLAFEQKQL